MALPGRCPSLTSCGSVGAVVRRATAPSTLPQVRTERRNRTASHSRGSGKGFFVLFVGLCEDLAGLDHPVGPTEAKGENEEPRARGTFARRFSMEFCASTGRTVVWTQPGTVAEGGEVIQTFQVRRAMQRTEPQRCHPQRHDGHTRGSHARRPPVASGGGASEGREAESSCTTRNTCHQQRKTGIMWKIKLGDLPTVLLAVRTACGNSARDACGIWRPEHSARTACAFRGSHRGPDDHQRLHTAERN